ncbi:rhombosortase [Pelomonas sp. SE-A7]|uniref:rhombosortase n=1 Tax=Pelomonas sp. SE-A7 TaxID=3054953 RepID=UPI00259CC997|nr:rhombosortase [Pelomonas sp. SE-A7]MDM4766943.1 rhombosortase [Pelomonas sp. SE-A7]
MARGLRLTEQAWPLLAGLAALAALVLFPLTLRPPVASPLAALVHLNERHLLANLAGCAVLGWLGWRARMGTAEALAWLLAWPLAQFALLLGPPLERFAGLSGWLHGGAALIAVSLLARTGRERLIGAVLLAGLGAKLLLEQPFAPPAFDPGWGFAPVPFAHLAGSLIGASLALLTRYWPLRTSRRQDP